VTIKVDQLLHGYRRGHEQLAGSLNLNARDAELVARLSDLSGTLSDSMAFESYITVYPLTSGTRYAIAQTWPDAKASRSGCVITHTLLIPMDAWRLVPRPMDFSGLFRCPVERGSDDEYASTLPWPSPSAEMGSKHSPSPASFDFVQRYFA